MNVLEEIKIDLHSLLALTMFDFALSFVPDTIITTRKTGLSLYQFPGSLAFLYPHRSLQCHYYHR
jgi:hypothetical protein